MSAMNEPSGGRKTSEGDDWSVDCFYHTVVNVTDLDRSIAFYQKLGFIVLDDRRNAVWPDFVATNFGMQRAKGRGALMVLASDPEGPIIDLVEWTEPRFWPPTGPDRIPQILAFRTRNVARAYAALQARGVEFTNTLIGPDDALGLRGVCCCLDPDRNVVELIEHAPGRRHSRTDDL